jgi:hypothetical protein
VPVVDGTAPAGGTTTRREPRTATGSLSQP